MKKLKSLIIAASAIMLLAISSVVVAWYVNVNRSGTEAVELTSNGIVVEYYIDDDLKQNPVSFDLRGLAFFDIDNQREGYYFSAMAVETVFKLKNAATAEIDFSLELDDSAYLEERSYTITSNQFTVKNSSDDILDLVSYTLENGKIKELTADDYTSYLCTYVIDTDGLGFSAYYKDTNEIVYRIDDIEISAGAIVGANVISGQPYISCIITDQQIENTVIDANKNKTVEEIIAAMKTTDNKAVSKKIELPGMEQDEEATLYIYFFGVQPNDRATNNFFGEKYSVKLLIKAYGAELE